jgi:hypothetical protein
MDKKSAYMRLRRGKGSVWMEPELENELMFMFSDSDIKLYPVGIRELDEMSVETIGIETLTQELAEVIYRYNIDLGEIAGHLTLLELVGEIQPDNECTAKSSILVARGKYV